MPNLNINEQENPFCVMTLYVNQDPSWNTPPEDVYGHHVGVDGDISPWFDGNAFHQGEEKTCYYYNGALVSGVSNLILPPLYKKIFRLSTDRNKGLLERLKDMPRIYELKTVLVKDVCKAERYYDYKKFKWRWRPVMLEVQRLVPKKRDLTKILKRHRDRVSNDLTYESVTYPSLGDDVFSMEFEDRFSGGNFNLIHTDTTGTHEGVGYPDFYRQWILLFRGSPCALYLPDTTQMGGGTWPNELFHGFPSMPWGPDYLDTSDPAGWPGTHGKLDESFLAPFSSAITELEEKTLAKLYSRIKNAKLDLATDLAEISQTIGLISDLATTIGKAFLLLKKGDVFNALKTLVPSNRAQVSNAFLAYRYGVEPLMSDVVGAAEHLAERILGIAPLPVKAKKRRKIVTTEVLNQDPDTFQRIDPLQPFVTLTTTTVIDIKYSVTYVINGTETLSNLSRLGFTSPTNVTWELIPFSFIVDWFLPIGNYLSSLSALEGYTVKEITRTQVVRQTIEGHVFLPPPDADPVNQWFSRTGITCNWKVEKLKIRRETLESLPSLPIPRFRNPFTLGRLANAIALLSQMFKGK